MRLILSNPHSHNFGKLLSGVVFRRKSSLKYEYFLKEYSKKQNQLGFFCDGTRSSFGFLPNAFSKIFTIAELYIWMIINHINPLKFRVYWNVSSLNPDTDVLFDFSKSLVDVDEKNKDNAVWSQYKGLTLIHFTHYFKDIKKLSENFKMINNSLAVAESDLTRNDFFHRYFPSVEFVYQLPFTYTERFYDKNDFQKRKNKCLALGSIIRIKNKEFIDFFGDQEGLHPMRKEIYLGSREYTKEIDSLISGCADPVSSRAIKKNDSLGARFIKRHFPYFILEKIYPTPQLQYFKFDIVDKFNNYKMFISPEESVGLPSINVFEGMACKCAYIGIDDIMYTNLGLVPGVHYIAYKKNDIDDLRLKIIYYQRRPEELEKIATNGYDFVRRYLNSEKISETFWTDLEAISQEFVSSGKVKEVCGFKRTI